MNKRQDLILPYAYLDSQRLKDTFFSLPKKKNFFKKRNLLPLATILITLLFFLLINYDLILIPPLWQPQTDNTISLFHNDVVSSLHFLGIDKRLIKMGNSSIFLSIPFHEKVGVRFDLKKPINLKTNNLFLCLKKTNLPLNMEIIVKDARFFSNSLKPFHVEINQENNSSDIKIPLTFKNASLQNTNLAQINQIKLYFYFPEDEAVSSQLIPLAARRWVFIKDFVVRKNDHARIHEL
ncbi:MAG: hypothetical protein JSW40_09425 [Candidatus Omnitrophota bacterium]|nr:MAG: hypothetical protein JSW40_09425 [Candidatus Omnitrophota bacterium]